MAKPGLFWVLSIMGLVLRDVVIQPRGNTTKRNVGVIQPRGVHGGGESLPCVAKAKLSASGYHAEEHSQFRLLFTLLYLTLQINLKKADAARSLCCHHRDDIAVHITISVLAQCTVTSGLWYLPSSSLIQKWYEPIQRFTNYFIGCDELSSKTVSVTCVKHCMHISVELVSFLFIIWGGRNWPACACTG